MNYKMLDWIYSRILTSVYERLQNYYAVEKANVLKNIQFKSVGANFKIGKDYRIRGESAIEIGDNFQALERFRIETYSSFNQQVFTPKLKIGNNVTFNTDIHIGCINEIRIGDNCLFASRIFITDHDHGDTSAETVLQLPNNRLLYSKGPVLIGDNCWIGEGVSILAGVTIGNNSIIATNSVVTKDVPPFTVVGGIPAKPIKVIKIY